MSQKKETHKIEVVALFRTGHIEPVIFKWNNGKYKIKTVTLAYQERDGASMNYYFSIVAENGNVFKLRYNDQKLTWWLEEIWVD